MTLFWTAVGNLARWIAEWADRQIAIPRDPVTLVREAWVSATLKKAK